uniref:Uncharacterized protein n=1 Tax=Anguilla anguilla TaxID=7936 RepID=A0A0E9TFB5_ANGAN
MSAFSYSVFHFKIVTRLTQWSFFPIVLDKTQASFDPWFCFASVD